MYTVDAYTRRIAVLERLLKAEKRARKALINSERMKAQQKDPAFVAKRMAAQRKADADPAKRAARSAKIRAACLRSPRALPPMTAEQKREYLQFTRGKGFPRSEALRILGIPDRSSPPTVPLRGDRESAPSQVPQPAPLSPNGGAGTHSHGQRDGLAD